MVQFQYRCMKNTNLILIMLSIGLLCSISAELQKAYLLFTLVIILFVYPLDFLPSYNLESLRCLFGFSNFYSSDSVATPTDGNLFKSSSSLGARGDARKQGLN